MRNTKLVCLVVSAIALMIATPALAATTVRLLDSHGAPLTDCSLAAYRADGSLLAKMGPSGTGTYALAAFPGDKLTFDVGGPSTGYVFGIEKIVPAGVGPNMITITLDMAPPANDLCENALTIAPGGVGSGSTVEATVDPNAPSPCGGFGVTAPGVWYALAGTGTEVTLSLANSDYDTKLHAYCGDCDALTCVDGDDDGGPGLTSEMTICTQVGGTYNVLVSGFGSATGNYELTVTDTGVACTPEVDCLPPVPTGACCSCLAPPFNCSILTEEECSALGADYAGDDSGCFTTGADLLPYVSMPGIGFIDNTVVSDTIIVTDDIEIGDVDVDLIATHTWLSDLEVTLTGPDGTSVPLWFDACGSNDDIDVIFDDEGNPVVCGSPTTGVIDPTTVGGGDLGAFEGKLSAGEWTMSINDDAGGDTGTWIQWSLHFAPGQPTCPDPPVCGNGIVEPGEDCDDGNLIPGDGCSPDCSFECTGSDEDEDEDEEGDGSGYYAPGH